MYVLCLPRADITYLNKHLFFQWMSVLEESLLNILIVVWFHFRESAINPHISICKPPLEENMVCGPINFFKNVYIGAQVQQACGPCKKGLVCKQVGWVSSNTVYYCSPWCVKGPMLAQDNSITSRIFTATWNVCSSHYTQHTTFGWKNLIASNSAMTYNHRTRDFIA